MQHSGSNAADDLNMVFETSWEVCNKIGGIYTVLSTKARILKEKYGDNLFFIGPDVWSEKNRSPYFREQLPPFKCPEEITNLPYNIKIRFGKWDIPGSPNVVLVKFDGVFPFLNDFFGEMWETFGVNSMNEYGDYREGCAFAVASAIVIDAIISHVKADRKKVIAHFNEWTTAMGLLYVEKYFPDIATVFTTHATSIGRSICGNGKPLYDYFDGYHGDQMAGELNMEAKHSLEKQAAHHADCFTAVSDLTAKECRQLLDITPQIVTPNGFEPDFVPESKKYKKYKTEGRRKIIEIASKLGGKIIDDDCLIIATSGRNEYRNKGIDLFIESCIRLAEKKPGKDVISLILVPAWVKEPSHELENALSTGLTESEKKIDLCYATHRLYNEDTDLIFTRLKAIAASNTSLREKINLIYIPCYLDEKDGIVNIGYYNLLPALDITVFPSYYEPWGYTPLESIAFGIPTVTTDKSGFGEWVLSNFSNSIYDSGVSVIKRSDSNFSSAADEISNVLADYLNASAANRKKAEANAVKTSEKADWKYFIPFYERAYEIAFERRDERISKRISN